MCTYARPPHGKIAHTVSTCARRGASVLGCIMYSCSHVPCDPLCSCTPVLLYFCTPVLLLLYFCTLVPLCTHSLLYSCTPVLLYSCSSVLLYSCDSVFLCPRTPVLFSFCISVLLDCWTSALLCSCIFVSLRPPAMAVIRTRNPQCAHSPRTVHVQSTLQSTLKNW